MKPEEELCRLALDNLLRKQGHYPIWSDGKEPPDYFLHFGEHKLAVEVTSIHGFTNLDGKNYSQALLSKELLSFGASISETIESQVNFRGCYILSLPAMPRLKNWKKEILQSLLAYFEKEASSSAEMKRTVILRPEGRSIAVWKVKNEGKAISPQSLPGAAFLSHREDQLTGLLTVAVKTKAQKLRGINVPWVLVILDYYGFQRSLAEWKERLPSEISFFEAVIRIQQGFAEIVAGNL